MKKRIISMLLAVLMLVSLFPAQVFAEATTEQPTEEPIEVTVDTAIESEESAPITEEKETDEAVSEISDVIDSGECGEAVTWAFCDDGTLTISGSGGMDSFEWNMQNSPTAQ